MRLSFAITTALLLVSYVTAIPVPVYPDTPGGSGSGSQDTHYNPYFPESAGGYYQGYVPPLPQGHFGRSPSSNAPSPHAPSPHSQASPQGSAGNYGSPAHMPSPHSQASPQGSAGNYGSPAHMPSPGYLSPPYIPSPHSQPSPPHGSPSNYVPPLPPQAVAGPSNLQHQLPPPAHHYSTFPAVSHPPQPAQPANLPHSAQYGRFRTAPQPPQPPPVPQGQPSFGPSFRVPQHSGYVPGPVNPVQFRPFHQDQLTGGPTNPGFQCTYPGCLKVYKTEAGRDKHFRDKHT